MTARREPHARIVRVIHYVGNSGVAQPRRLHAFGGLKHAGCVNKPLEGHVGIDAAGNDVGPQGRAVFEQHAALQVLGAPGDYLQKPVSGGMGIFHDSNDNGAWDSRDELVEVARPRLRALMGGGVTTVEIKSGYGLDIEAETKMLRAARALGESEAVRVATTLLALHALPPEFRNRREEYVRLAIEAILPAVTREDLADAVDAFCEGIGFTPGEVRAFFEAARDLDLGIKLHAEQLSNLGGAALAARFDALSADHLEHVDEAGVKAMAEAGMVAVLLPGAFYALKETKKPPVDLLRLHKVPMAVATDCNPGTSPVLSPTLMLSMACTLFGLTPEEALAGMTREGARALGLADECGTISAGKAADLCVWRIGRPAELCYWVGHPGPERRIVSGEDA